MVPHWVNCSLCREVIHASGTGSFVNYWNALADEQNIAKASCVSLTSVKQIPIKNRVNEDWFLKESHVPYTSPGTGSLVFWSEIPTAHWAGCAVTSPELRARSPAFGRLAGSGGHPQLLSVGTLFPISCKAWGKKRLIEVRSQLLFF